MVRLLVVCSVLALTLCPAVVLANKEGMPDHTGSPIHTVGCDDCHSGAHGATLVISGPVQYEPGTTYDIYVRVTGGPAVDWGFDVETLDSANAEAGTATIVDEDNTQLDAGTNTQVYHTIFGAYTNSWNYQWTAPESDIGPITFYGCGVSGNGNLTSGDDVCYVTFPVLPPGVVTPTQTAIITITPWITQTLTPTGMTETPTPTVTGTGTPPGPTATETLTPTATPTITVTETPTGTTATPTPATIELAFEMPDTVFSTGEECYLNLLINNPGSEQEVDLYVLLEVFNNYWFYPSWGQTVDFEQMTVTAGMNESKVIIPTFTFPAVGPAGPFHFYGAMFTHGFLDLDHLVSTGAAWEFSFE